MKKDKKVQAIANKAQKAGSIKKDLPIKNAMTDAVKNTALQTQGLNQAKITRDDLLPSDGDNLTNT
ncbi:MAG: hypothetical protein ABIO79_07485 [Ferruginibacter sp.]